MGYARVSSHAQKDDLERQIELIKAYAEERGWEMEILKDVGSGLKEDRRNFKKLLKKVTRKFLRLLLLTQIDRRAFQNIGGAFYELRNRNNCHKS